MTWCKQRALEYLNLDSEWYSPKKAITSMLSDLRKHEDTNTEFLTGFANPMGLKIIIDGADHKEVKDFIDGFN